MASVMAWGKLSHSCAKVKVNTEFLKQVEVFASWWVYLVHKDEISGLSTLITTPADLRQDRMELCWQESETRGFSTEHALADLIQCQIHVIVISVCLSLRSKDQCQFDESRTGGSWVIACGYLEMNSCANFLSATSHISDQMASISKRYLTSH